MVQDLPDGTVTVLFTDVEGSTELGATAGGATARDLLRAAGGPLRRACAVGPAGTPVSPALPVS